MARIHFIALSRSGFRCLMRHVLSHSSILLMPMLAPAHYRLLAHSSTGPDGDAGIISRQRPAGVDVWGDLTIISVMSKNSAADISSS